MGKPQQDSPGQVLRTTPQPGSRVLQSSDGDDEIAFEASSVVSDSPSSSDLGLIDNQDHSKDNIHGTRSVPERHTNQPRPSLNKCVRARTELNTKKRKSPTLSISVPDKKARLDEGTSHLSRRSGSWQFPAEIWQHIFVLLPPKMLGRLLSVNKCFNSFLDPSSNYSCDAPQPVLTGSLSNLTPEVIWQRSRRRFWPTMPTPLRDHTELQMWRLACQVGCQFCGRTGLHLTNGEYKHTGPRPIWPFALRSCEACLVGRTTKEVDLLLSSSVPSCLIPALPFIFMNDKMEIIPSAKLQAGQAPLESPVTKFFLSNNVAAIHEEFNLVGAMGKATAEEWLKGLEGRGKEHLTDSLRWEKFEMSGGIIRMRQRLSSDNTQPNNELDEAIKEPIPSTAVPPATSTPPFISSRESSCARSIQEYQESLQVNISRSKTREEAEEMKAARRAEIERRATKLEPPLAANVLALIPSFQAAIQITTPLDDTAWSLLKPRLIAQRGDIDQEQHQKQESPAHSLANPKQSEDAQTLRRHTLEVKQKANKTWDDAQAPLRAQLSVLADQFIRNSWGNGRKVNKESSPKFAVDVLLYVRRRFYAEIEKDDTATRAAGKEPPCEAPDGPFTRKLTLENMKWLFDVKVKPFTEPYMKELFYCRCCVSSNKLYGFEAVVQHYAAKHTSCLSLGSVVVYWRAEWPEEPPFDPERHMLVNQLADLPKHQQNRALRAIPITPHGQPLHQEGMTPHYGQPMPTIQYHGVPIQPLHGQMHPYIPPSQDYDHSFQGQALQDHSNLLPNGTIYQEPPGIYHGGGLYGSNVDVHQSLSHIPHKTYTAPELQYSYHIQSPDAHYEKLDSIARNSRELWFSLSPLKGLSGHIRIFVVIYHVCARFRAQFSEEPPLSLFMDGLSNNKEMRPIRSINGLQCKACCLGLGTTATTDRDRESYSLPQLVKHFYQWHIEQQHTLAAPVLDWSTDMIHLPDLRILSNLDSLTNIDNRKLALINGALPEATSSSSQSRAGPGRIDPLLLDRKISDLRHNSSPVYVSNKRALVQQPHIQNKKIFSQTINGDLVTRNVGEVMPEANQPSPYLAGLDNSGVRSKPSISKTGHQPIKKVPADTTATSNTDSTIENPSVERPSHTAENDGDDDDDDDDFDLLAGLESQLDRQASSIRPENTLGRDS
ncbi:hypothetical protein F5Y12DRAFT_247547 [Xylaria sp. FL1777]|nr:hypothetical protein F5Y12DRAFT_247547 [Xylaria sp. FL1777]